jgi:hypothetical protein
MRFCSRLGLNDFATHVMPTIRADHMRWNRSAALLACGKLLGRFEVVRTATACAGVTLPALRNSHLYSPPETHQRYVKQPILNYRREAVNRSCDCRRAHESLWNRQAKWVPYPRLPWACGDFLRIFMPSASVGMAPYGKLIGPGVLGGMVVLWAIGERGQWPEAASATPARGGGGLELAQKQLRRTELIPFKRIEIRSTTKSRCCFWTGLGLVRVISSLPSHAHLNHTARRFRTTVRVFTSPGPARISHHAGKNCNSVFGGADILVCQMRHAFSRQTGMSAPPW